MWIHVKTELPKNSDDVAVALWSSKNDEYDLRIDYYNHVINRWGLTKDNTPVVYWMHIPSVYELPHPLD